MVIIYCHSLEVKLYLGGCVRYLNWFLVDKDELLSKINTSEVWPADSILVVCLCFFPCLSQRHSCAETYTSIHAWTKAFAIHPLSHGANRGSPAPLCSTEESATIVTEQHTLQPFSGAPESQVSEELNTGASQHLKARFGKRFSLYFTALCHFIFCPSLSQ